ncbi:2-oxoglutarate dehydrogenase, E2 component, dihydrolipoamide succinyltransferase [Frigoribacterium sp. PvP032]|uniref:2-oxoglutarate dehydrogenase, E2 component, dihydrolipoamide succinyltransferase n=1 Tax=Frigoribacterium sp. PvP032 TaxID=2806589 RepID=UPI001AE7CCF7|nr:2-oxoglutarate dehydrogenase, E2 component, dihydrolipoamide succinyltransferase [Frigoribacterium sp. PvP032]MBP1190697.1 2-oxoglutarate dehydrogenase E2 component (dihydrolipoamide succinyltransferase) [Frigoribacterium sp. PvP032]
MSESVNLPALGESVTEGTVTRWLKNVGDRVEVDEPLLEVSTDKVDTEIPSPVAGVVEEILVAEDETVEVGTALVRIGDGSGQGGDSADDAPAEETTEAEQPEAPAEGGQDDADDAVVASAAAPAPGEEADSDAPAPADDVDPAPAAEQPADQAPAVPATAPAAAAPPAAAAAPAAAAPPAAPAAAAPAAAAPAPAAAAPAAAASSAPADTSSAPTGYVTPLVRKLANEKGVDISTLSGSGVGGRIRKEDVLAAAEAASSASSAATSAPAPVEVSPLRGTTVPMTRLRKVVAERAVQSMQAMAQLTSVVEVDVTAVAKFRDANKAAFLEKTGNKLSFLPFFTLAAAEALKAHPKLNATVDGDSIVYPDHENVSMAVDTERGLLTPVIKDASDLDLAGIAAQIADLAQRTRDNKLKPDELAGGTFTVTNTGSRGALFDTPVVFLPQVAILGTGVVVKRPVVVSVDGADAIAVRSMVYLALSYDHRIVDGADAARFLVAVKARLEAGDFAGVLGI